MTQSPRGKGAWVVRITDKVIPPADIEQAASP